MPQNDKHQLSLITLITLAVGAMIGAGIFSLPQNVAASSGVGAMLIGWGITAIGMLMIALIFQILSERKSELNAGVYAYARAGFGEYIGFSLAWGYWISAWLGNVSYFVLLFSTLGYFSPFLGEGNTPAAILCASVLLWIIHFLVMRGVKEAALVNTIMTFAKIIPLFIFILISLSAFRVDIFTADIWGANSPVIGGVTDQLSHMMLVTVWVFIGIEGANVFSSRAAKRTDIGKATVIAFLFVLLLYVLVSFLSFGILLQPDLAKLHNPSMMGVLEHVVGPWGATLIAVGVLISLLGALVSWLLLSSEILFVVAQSHAVPAFLSRENAKQVPVNALWLTNGLIQLFLIITLFAHSTYLTLIYLSASMILIPYLGTAAYGLLLVWRGETYTAVQHKVRYRHFVIASLAVIYSVWLLYAGGTKYLLLSALLYAPGTILFAWERYKAKQVIFKRFEKFVFAMIMFGALFSFYALYQGQIQL